MRTVALRIYSTPSKVAMQRSQTTRRPMFAQLNSLESVWKDPYTQTILAPGARQNWPRKGDEEYLKTLNAQLAQARKREVERGSDRTAPLSNTAA